NIDLPLERVRFISVQSFDITTGILELEKFLDNMKSHSQTQIHLMTQSKTVLKIYDLMGNHADKYRIKVNEVKKDRLGFGLNGSFSDSDKKSLFKQEVSLNTEVLNKAKHSRNGLKFAHSSFRNQFPRLTSLVIVLSEWYSVGMMHRE